MRILRVSQDIYPDTVGGAPYHIHALSRDQAAMGHDVTVLSVSNEKPKRETRDGYTLIRQRPVAELFGNQLSISSWIPRHIREYDIVHSHSHLYFLSNIATAFNTVSTTPLVVTCHGLNSQTAPAWVSNLHLKTVGRWMYTVSDVTFCYTEEERRMLKEYGVEGKVRVISNGIDPTLFTPDGPVFDIDVAPDEKVVLFVGRLVEGKCPGDILEAFKHASENGPELRLIFCGDGPLRSDLENRAGQWGLSDRVDFLGYIPHQEMPSLYRLADIFVLTSRTEGFPRTVMEALACETPILTSRLDQLTSVIDVAGRGVESGDVSAIASRIEELATDPDLRDRLGTKGRELVVEQYNWVDTVEQTTMHMSELIEARSERPKPAIKGEIR